MTVERPSPDITDDNDDNQAASKTGSVESEPESFSPAPQLQRTQTLLKFFGANLVGRGIATTLAELEEKIARHADDHFLSIVSCSITVDNETGQRPYYIAAVVFQKLP